MNAEFQRIARRDKKASLSDQCKEIEEGNRMVKTRDLLKKISDTMQKMGTIKDRNGMDLTEAEVIKKKWKHTWKNYTKKVFMTQIKTGVITHLEPDILECEVKWSLGIFTTNKASGGDRIPDELFQILHDDAALNMPTNLENSAVATELEKVSFHSNCK